MAVDMETVAALKKDIDPAMLERIEQTADRIAAAKDKGGKVVVVTGSGPNVHEGVTTLIAELMRLGVIDGVTTSSAVVAHEMGGVLDEVKRVDGKTVGVDKAMLPHGDTFELTSLDGLTFVIRHVCCLTFFVWYTPGSIFLYLKSSTLFKVCC